jgi:hypothetical protein
VIVIQVLPLAVQEQPLPAFTLTLPLPPVAAIDALVSEIE